MRRLLKCTVRPAVEIGLLYLAVQAVAGTKVAANAAGETWDMARLEKLPARTEDAISKLQAQNKSGDEPSPPCLPVELQHAMSRLAQDHHIIRVNHTDQDDQLMKGRRGPGGGRHGRPYRIFGGYKWLVEG